MTETQKFVEKLLGDTLTTMLAAIGDKLGLFKDLTNKGPAKSQQLATRTGLNERYVREWLGGMTSAGYLEYDPAKSSFSIPSEHVPALAQENSEVFFGGVHQLRQSGGEQRTISSNVSWLQRFLLRDNIARSRRRRFGIARISRTKSSGVMFHSRVSKNPPHSVG